MKSKIRNSIFNSIYLLIIIYLITFIPSFFGYKPLVVISASMEPKIKVGSIIYYHDKDINSFNKKDILVYRINNHTVVHRIIEISEDGFITKGDANRDIDQNEVYKNQVLGKSNDWCIPFLGYYINFIYHHKFLLYLCIVILAIDLHNENYHKKGKFKNEKNV